MNKPIIGTAAVPSSSSSSVPASLPSSNAAFPGMTPEQVADYAAGGSGGIAMPTGPGGIPFPPPSGPDGMAFERNTAEDSTMPLRETLCVGCKHGLVLEAAAPVKNRKGPEFGADAGKAFTFDYGVCTFVTPPMPLEDLKPLRCSRFEKAEKQFVFGGDNNEENTSE